MIWSGSRVCASRDSMVCPMVCSSLCAGTKTVMYIFSSFLCQVPGRPPRERDIGQRRTALGGECQPVRKPGQETYGPGRPGLQLCPVPQVVGKGDEHAAVHCAMSGDARVSPTVTGSAGRAASPRREHSSSSVSASLTNRRTPASWPAGANPHTRIRSRSSRSTIPTACTGGSLR